MNIPSNVVTKEFLIFKIGSSPNELRIVYLIIVLKLGRNAFVKAILQGLWSRVLWVNTIHFIKFARYIELYYRKLEIYLHVRSVTVKACHFGRLSIERYHFLLYGLLYSL